MKKRYLFPEDYMADPSVHVFNGRVYIYPSHDWECENVENGPAASFGTATFRSMRSRFPQMQRNRLREWATARKPSVTSCTFP